MKRLSVIFFSLLLLAGNQLSAQSIDLLNNSTEDGDFSEYTATSKGDLANQTNFWTPTLKPGTGFWGADGTTGSTRTSVRVHDTTNPPDNVNYHSAYHYLQVLMDNGSLGSNYIWRKISGLTPGATYTFSFYYKIPLILSDRSVKFGVTDDVANINVNPTANEANTLTNLLGGQLLNFSNTAGSGEPYTQASYIFTVPAGKTEIYAVWLRSHSVDRSGSGTHRIWLDDMSLFKHVQEVQTGDSLIVDKDASINSITLKPGSKLNINSGKTLNATVGITLESDENGTATIKNNGTYSGTITAQQYLGTARNWYVSSPVVNPATPGFTTTPDFTGIDYYYEYMEGGNNTNTAGQPGSPTLYWKGVNKGSEMAVGKGYIAKANEGTTISFTGTPNNGDIETSFNLTRNDTKGKGFNLAGNPYPSYIDWADVAVANPNLENTYYYRTKNIDETYAFVTWNGSGNTFVNSKGGTANTTITRFIPPTQAFWVRVKTGTSATKMYFNNDMREHRDVNGNLMKAPRQDTRTSVRLQLINGTQRDELLIYQDAGASNDYDSYDSPKMMNNSTTVPDLYSIAGDEQLVINGLNTITENMELPLGFSLKSAAALTIKATELNNLPEGMNVYLLDKTANTQTQLTPETEYTFTTTQATTNDESRFSLLFKSPSLTTSVEASDLSKHAVYVNAQNELVIIAPENSTYAIYTLVGEQVNAGRVTDNAVRVNTVSKGVYLVKVNNRTMKVAIR